MSENICVSKQRKSLLELCEKEEWNVICDLIPEMIHWNFNEENEEGKNPLIICCEKGSLQVLQQLYNAKEFDLNKKICEKFSLLLIAASNGHLEIVKWLLQNGCSTDERNDNGDTCILVAAENGQLETVKWLVQNGCSLEEENDDGITCILMAAKAGKLETLKWIELNGYKLIKDRSYFNESCLLLAARHGHLDSKMVNTNWMLS